jgi:hypothetical protein
MRTLLIKVSVLLAGVLAGDCVAQSIGQTSSASTMENITRFHPGVVRKNSIRVMPLFLRGCIRDVSRPGSTC